MIDTIFEEIAAERQRQNEKWGEQNHAMLAFYTQEDILKKEALMKSMNDDRNNISWFSILAEEVYEAFAETDPEKQRKEMIQIAAVAVQIIEYLDRR